MSGCVLRERGRLQQRSPVPIGFGCLIAITVGLLNGCNRSPPVVDVLAIPTDNRSVCHCDVYQGEQTGISLNRVASRVMEFINVLIVPIPYNSLSDLIPMTGWCRGARSISPEFGDLCLFLRTRSTVDVAQCF